MLFIYDVLFIYNGNSFPDQLFSHIHRFVSPSPWKTIDRGSTVYILPNILFLNTLHLYFSFNVKDQFHTHAKLQVHFHIFW